MDIKPPYDEQATIIQLQARLQVLGKMKLEMLETLDKQQKEYNTVCKKLNDVTENFCKEASQFVSRYSIYSEAQKNRKVLLSKAMIQLQKDHKKLDYELVKLRNKEKLVSAEQSKIDNAEKELEALRQKTLELKTELKTHKQTIEKLEKEKEIVDAYPTRDSNFLRLKETLIAARESERKKEQAFKNLGGLR